MTEDAGCFVLYSGSFLSVLRAESLKNGCRFPGVRARTSDARQRRRSLSGNTAPATARRQANLRGIGGGGSCQLLAKCQPAALTKLQERLPCHLTPEPSSPLRKPANLHVGRWRAPGKSADAERKESGPFRRAKKTGCRGSVWRAPGLVRRSDQVSRPNYMVTWASSAAPIAHELDVAVLPLAPQRACPGYQESGLPSPARFGSRRFDENQPSARAVLGTRPALREGSVRFRRVGTWRCEDESWPLEHLRFPHKRRPDMHLPCLHLLGIHLHCCTPAEKRERPRRPVRTYIATVSAFSRTTLI